MKELRKKLGLDQVSFAAELGVIQQTVSAWERGRNTPTDEMLIKICAKYNLNTDYFFEDRQDPIRIYINKMIKNGHIKDVNNIPAEVQGLIMDFIIMDLKERKLNAC
jgi:transcriptional regulator with XRE-family HTH domain